MNTLPHQVLELLQRYEEQCEAGEPPDPVHFCAARPDLLPAFLEGVRLLQRFREHKADPTVRDPTPPPTVSDDRPMGPPPEVPGYDIEGILGWGGMGVVYKARQRKPGRLCALKVLLTGPHSRADDRRRFEAEGQALASLQHPHVVQVFEVGETQGLPFIALEFCPGGSLDKRLAGGVLPAREAARLIEQVARGVHAAHRKRVLHRDLKPSNILLGEDGTPKVGDFGLAKHVDADARQSADESNKTATGTIMGTPSYMSPEQALGNRDLGPAADVWSLGAILYCCLTGHPPFRAATPMDTLMQVVWTEPVAVRRWAADVPADLEAIVHKCLAKEPERRYASAEALADDLARFQAGQPVHAQPMGLLERAARWCRGNPVVAGLIVAVVLLLLGGTATATYFALEARKEATAAREAEQKARDQEQKARFQARRAEQANHAIQVDLAQRAWRERDLVRAGQLLDDMPEAFRATWEARHLRAVCARTLRTLPPSPAPPTALAFSPDGTFLLGRDSEGGLRVWTVAGGREVLALPKAVAAVFSPDGEHLAVADRLTVHVRHIRSDREVHTLTGCTQTIAAVAYSPDGKRILAASRDRTLRLWDAVAGTEVAILEGHEDALVAAGFSPDGTTILSEDEGQVVRVWNTATGEELFQLPVSGAEFGSVGETIFAGRGERTPVLFDAATGARHFALAGHTGAVLGVAFDRSGKLLATAGADGLVLVWDAWTGREIHKLAGHLQRVAAVAFTPDGRALVSAGVDGTLRVWDVGTGRELAVLRGQSVPLTSLAVAADGRTVAVGGGTTGGVVHLWDLAARQERLVRDGHSGPVRCVAYSPDGKRLLSGGDDRQPRLWDAGGRPRGTLSPHPREVVGLCFSRDGRLIATGSGAFHDPGVVSVWDAGTGEELFRLAAHDEGIGSLRFSPTADVLLSTSYDGTLKLWDATTGALLRVLRGHTNAVSCAAFSPDGKTIVSGSGDRTLRRWDAATGQELGQLGETLPREPHCVAYSPDGKTLAVGCDDWLIRLWDADGRGEPRVLKGHRKAVQSVCFCPDGKTLLSGGLDGTLRLWDAETGQEKLTIEAHAGPVRCACFSPDGKTIVSGGNDQQLKFWVAP